MTECTVCTKGDDYGAVQLTDCCDTHFHWAAHCAGALGIAVETDTPGGDILCATCEPEGEAGTERKALARRWREWCADGHIMNT